MCKPRPPPRSALCAHRRDRRRGRPPPHCRRSLGWSARRWRRYGAELVERDGRYTGASGELPIGDTKVQLFKKSVAASARSTVGYGDHPTDVPFLLECDRGVLVHRLSDDDARGCEFEPAREMDAAKLSELVARADSA